MSYVAEAILSEELLTAVLNRVAAEKVSAHELEKVCAVAAKKFAGPWESFSLDGQYGYSLGFSEVLSNLLLGGSVNRIGSTGLLLVSEHTRGPYGLSLYTSLPGTLASEVEEVAEEMRRA